MQVWREAREWLALPLSEGPVDGDAAGGVPGRRAPPKTQGVTGDLAVVYAGHRIVAEVRELHNTNGTAIDPDPSMPLPELFAKIKTTS